MYVTRTQQDYLENSDKMMSVKQHVKLYWQKSDIRRKPKEARGMEKWGGGGCSSDIGESWDYWWSVASIKITWKSLFLHPHLGKVPVPV